MVMKKIFAILATAVATCLVVACDMDFIDDAYVSTSRYLLSVQNVSDTDVIWFVPDHGDVDCKDVTGELPETLTARLETNFYSAKAKSYNSIYIYDGGVTSTLETYHADDLVTFYFFDAKVFETTDWATIKADKLWLARYTYSAEDVINMNKLIVYPAAE